MPPYNKSKGKSPGGLPYETDGDAGPPTIEIIPLKETNLSRAKTFYEPKDNKNTRIYLSLFICVLP